MSRIVIPIIALCLGLAIGYWGQLHPQLNNIDNTEENIRSEQHLEPTDKNNTLTNPLLECDLGQEYISKNAVKPFTLAIKNQIDTEIANGKTNFVAYYFRDLNNGTWFGYNQNEKFRPASLLKIPFLFYFLKRAENEPSSLSDEVLYEGGNVDALQHYPAKDPVKIGKTYSVKDLLEHTIINSDNNAAELLAKVAGDNAINKIFTDIGLEIPGNGEEDYISVKQYASFFRILYNASYLNKEYSEAALTLLSMVDFSYGLRANIPKNIIIAHKFGEVANQSNDQKQLHDCGIVYYPKTSYLLCIMTRGTNFDDLANVIANLSQTTYEEVVRQKK